MKSASLVRTFGTARVRLFSFIGAALLALAAWSTPARADTLTIKNAGDHQRYFFEAEPRLMLGFIDPPGYAAGAGFGLGFRGSVPILHNGFIPKLNNSVAIGFGADFIRYGRADYCTDGGQVASCNRVRADNFFEFYFPVVIQWNFYLSRDWSVFGEPGIALNYHAWDGPRRIDFDPFIFFVGARYHFADRMTLTMRIGYPAFSVGVSFLL